MVCPQCVLSAWLADKDGCTVQRGQVISTLNEHLTLADGTEVNWPPAPPCPTPALRLCI